MRQVYDSRFIGDYLLDAFTEVTKSARSARQHKAWGEASAASETPGSHQEKLAQPTERAIAESSDESFVGFNSLHLEEFNELQD